MARLQRGKVDARLREIMRGVNGILFSLQLGIMMQPKFEYRDESAWNLGEQAYELDDTLETGVAKAARLGIRPGSNGYAAFITAFSRKMRSRQPMAHPGPGKSGDAPPGSAIVLTPDFLRAAS